MAQAAFQDGAGMEQNRAPVSKGPPDDKNGYLFRLNATGLPALAVPSRNENETGPCFKAHRFACRRENACPATARIFFTTVVNWNRGDDVDTNPAYVLSQDCWLESLMTKKAIESRVSGDVANVTLDKRMQANWLRHGLKGERKFTLRQMSEGIGGSPPVPPVTLHRLTTGSLDQILSARAKYGDIAGIDGLAIKKLFDTPLSRQAMRLEWRLRSADFKRYPADKAMLLIPEAEGLIEKMDASSDDLPWTEQLVHASLGAQVATYKARIDGPKRTAFFQDAQSRLRKTAERRTTILAGHTSVSFTDTVLAVRMESLAYFVEYHLQTLNDRNADLTAMARRVSSQSVLRAVERITKALGDPRIPINFAEAAGHVALVEGRNAKADAHNAQAAKMLGLTFETAGHTGPANEFAPDWLPGFTLSDSEELKVAVDLFESNKE